MATFAGFCADVCAQVRNRLDRPAIFAELTGHLEDRAAGFASRGLSRDEARDRAVAGMGDPAELGRALDRIHGPLWYRAYRVGLVVLLVAIAALVLLAAGNHVPILPRWGSLPTVVQVVDLESRTAAAWTVTGGGVLGDYRLTPSGDVDFTAGGGTCSGVFALRVSHAQPWLPNLRWENLTVTVEGPDGPLRGHVGGDWTDESRLISDRYEVHFYQTSAFTPGNYIVTLRSGVGSVGFAVDFAGEGGKA